MRISGRPGRRRAGRRRRPILLGIGLGAVVALVVAAALVIAKRPNEARLTEADYEAAMAGWDEKGPASYDVDVELSGKRPGTIHVEVRDRQVTHMIRDGVEPRQRRTWDVWSVPGMFDTLGQELENARNPAASFNTPAASQMVMWAEFDVKYGYPRRYDRVVLGADFEVHWRVTRFEPIVGEN